MLPPPLLCPPKRSVCVNSVLLFPFQLDALANLCPRPFTVLDIPFSFIERDTLAASLDWKNNRELRRCFAIAKSCVAGGVPALVIRE